MSVLDKFPPDVQRRIREAWFDDDVSREDLRRRFNLAESLLPKIAAELGPRPKLAMTVPRGQLARLQRERATAKWIRDRKK